MKIKQKLKYLTSHVRIPCHHGCNLIMYFVQDQLRRYIEIKQSDLPSAVAAKKTREFRCPPREQVRFYYHLFILFYIHVYQQYNLFSSSIIIFY